MASHDHHAHSCHMPPGKPDWLLRVCAVLIAILYLQAWLAPDIPVLPNWQAELAWSVQSLINTMWWGIVIGILMISLLGRIPREFVMAALGTGRGGVGILRATLAGVLLDLCSHGILMVGAKLYERGAGIGQVMAFLVASPWNSFSLTLVLIALIGLPWTLAFIGFSMLIAVMTGLVFQALVNRRILPANPNQSAISDDFRLWSGAVDRLRGFKPGPAWITGMFRDGLKESRMVLRWIFFGVLLASVVRALMPADSFQAFFGPTVAGLALTVVIATILEVCSEGSTPIAADLLTRAGAPGNSFTFLMTGVSTDYTEVMVLKEATGSWKIALFLPLVTVPQVILLGLLLNQFA